MILNPCCKLSIFGEETWSDLDPEEYSDQCHKRFQFDYISSATANASLCHRIKRLAPGDDDDCDDEFQAHLAARAVTSSHTTHDYDRDVNVPDDPTIKSAQGRRRANHPSYPDLRRMARDNLAVRA